MDRLCFLERENQSLQAENEKLRIEALKLKDPKIGKDFTKQYQNTKNVSCNEPSLFTEKNNTQKHHQIKRIKGRCAQENYQTLGYCQNTQVNISNQHRPAKMDGKYQNRVQQDIRLPQMCKLKLKQIIVSASLLASENVIQWIIRNNKRIFNFNSKRQRRQKAAGTLRCNPLENHTEENHERPPETNGYAAEVHTMI